MSCNSCKNERRGRMLAIIGGQYGSEGKGVISAGLANDFDMVVRVGSPNAGHSFYWNGEKHVMQTIPCGWINPKALVVIGRGALINEKKLLEEIEHIERFYPDFRSRLCIDSKAGILSEKFREMEGGTQGKMHQRIGSTGEGVGPAREARISRDPNRFQLFEERVDDLGLRGCMVYNTPKLIARYQDLGYNILLEGTQGSALSLLHSYWPYCTSIDTNASAILSECGIAPSRLDSVMLVARTFPIRVAGNSGPMRKETSWEVLSEKLGHPVTERTTVTQKIRRVAEWDDRLLDDAILYNCPTSIALTFMDYLDPEVTGTTNIGPILRSDKCKAFIDHFNARHGIPIALLGTGGPEFSLVRLIQDIYDM